MTFRMPDKEAVAAQALLDEFLNSSGEELEEHQKKICRNSLCVENPDMVNHPPHYGPAEGSGPECIEAIRASMARSAFQGFLKGNVLKYLWRYERKADTLEDLKKARFYLDMLVEDEAQWQGLVSEADFSPFAPLKEVKGE